MTSTPPASYSHNKTPSPAEQSGDSAQASAISSIIEKAPFLKASERRTTQDAEIKQMDSPLRMVRKAGYMPIEDYALIGNMHTAALVSKDSSIDSFCYPFFDSPSVFIRILDCELGGHFSIAPLLNAQAKQHYLPNTAIVVTKWLHEEGVVNVVDYMPRPRPSATSAKHPLYHYVVRRVEAIRGRVPLKLECFPAFNYARDEHNTKVSSGIKDQSKATFESKDLTLELVVVVTHIENEPKETVIKLREDGTAYPKMKGPGVSSEFTLQEGEVATFILREPLKTNETEIPELVAPSPDTLLTDTQDWWGAWLSQSNYKGRWREFVMRSAITLKLLTFEPTGAIVAAPTFSLPESLQGGRNWDYRFTWLRDASFTIYALIRLGFTREADAYMAFMKARICERGEQDVQIMYTIHGDREMSETILPHLSGYKDAGPVRIGNGAADHKQNDVYGEFLDAVYLHQKFGKPIDYDWWVEVRKLVDHVCEIWREPDMSIWEVRSKKQNFVYSKVMCWVAINRGLRLAEKRSLPCPNRMKWMTNLDEIYEEVMTKGWNAKAQHFCQSYEAPDVLDSSILIMPLCFFISASDPRFVSTLEQILKSPEKGGLCANSLLFRYDVHKAEDGVGGEEGAFSMCTLWAIEALSRAAQTSPDSKSMLKRANRMFDELLTYGNHVSLYAEEISSSGEALGNMPQAFTHVSSISTAFNLDRVFGSRNAM